MHLSDEGGWDDTAFYADVDYVLRNYWHAPVAPDARRAAPAAVFGAAVEAARTPVHWYPLGVTEGFLAAGDERFFRRAPNTERRRR